jgi:hypothetical protein
MWAFDRTKTDIPAMVLTTNGAEWFPLDQLLYFGERVRGWGQPQLP